MAALGSPLASWPTEGAAQEAPASDAPREGESWPAAFPIRLLVGAKGVASMGDPVAPDDTQWEGMAGAALYAEIELVEGWLNLELGGSFVAGWEERAGRFEPYLKVPFEVRRRAEVYLGLGPTFGTVVGPLGRWHVLGGAITTGWYVFFNPRVALDVDLTFEIASTQDKMLRDVALGIGCVARLGRLPHHEPTDHR